MARSLRTGPGLTALCAVAALTVLAVPLPARAQGTWTGNGLFNSTDPIDWSNPFNWASNSVPTSANNAGITFAVAPFGQSVNNLGTFNLNLLTFNTPVLLTGNPLSFHSFQFFGTVSPGITQSTAGPVTVQNDLSLTSTDFYLQGAGTGTLTLSGVVSGAATLRLISSSFTTVLSNGGNSYTGGTVLSGPLRTDASGALPAGRVVSVLSTTLDLNGTNQSIGSLFLGNTQSSSPAPVVQTGTGTLTLGGDVTYSPVGTAFGSSITGNLNLGTATRTFNVGSGGSFDDTAVSALITGSGGLTKTGAGVLALSNGGNAYTGGTVVQNGTLRTDAGGALPTGRNVTVQAGTLNLNTSNQSIGSLTLSDPSATNASPAPVVQLAGAHFLLGGNVTYNPSSTAPAATITGGTLDLGGPTRTFNIGFGAGPSYDTVIGAFIAGPGGLTKTGTGFLALTGGTSYSGPTTVTAGPLYLGVANAISSAVVVNGGLLSLNPFATAQGVTAGSYNQSFGSLAGSGGGVSLGSATLTVGTDNTSTSFTGNLSATGGTLVKVGTGTLALTGNNAGTYLGGVTVNGGVLAVSADNVLGGAANAVTVNPAGTLRYTSNASTSRTFNLTSGTLEAGAGATVTYNGATVAGGFLAGNFATQAGTSNLLAGGNLVPGATLTLNGIDGLVNYNQGGQLTVNPGSSASLTRTTNTASGRIAVGSGAGVSVSDFQSVGRIDVTGTGVLTNTGPSAMYFGGGSLTTIGGYNPATGQVTPGGSLNLGNQPLFLTGAFLRNNGSIDSTGPNAKLVVKGGGDINVRYEQRNGGLLLSGNSPGLSRQVFASLTGGQTQGADLSNATGTAGPPVGSSGTQLSGWGLIEYGQTAANVAADPGYLKVTATPSNKAVFKITTVQDGGLYNTPGAPANFDPAQSYTWTIFRPRSAADVSNPANVTPVNAAPPLEPIQLIDAVTNQVFSQSSGNLTVATLNQYLAFDSSAFFAAPGVLASTTGSFAFTLLPDALSNPNRVVAVTFSPVPEPAAALLVGLTTLAAGWRLRRATTLRKP
jgi:autotransporter-associated beta strand protein